MDGDAEKVGEVIASEITDAIESANERSENAAELVEALTDAAIEGERARRIGEIERDLGECLSNQSEMGQALAGMALQMGEIQGALLTLQALLPSIQSPQEPLPSDAADGPPESPEAEATVIVAPEAETVEAPQEAPKAERKRKRWI